LLSANASSVDSQEYAMIAPARRRHMSRSLALVVAMAVAAGCSSQAASLPDPTLDAPLASTHGTQTVVLAGGCFWGIQAVYQHVKGVKKATSGYSGGTAASADYETVSTGTTGHAESVEVVYDPAVVTFGQLLKVFFSVAHDPTQLNRQGPDFGTQYRSSIFYASAEQQRVAQAYIVELQAAKVFPRPIVTQLVPLKAFYAAEAYHQDYAVHHPNEPYIVFNDLPKVAHLQTLLPELYVSR
jgi:peptide-methionine (S)-S-oxide reductase